MADKNDVAIHEKIAQLIARAFLGPPGNEKPSRYNEVAERKREFYNHDGEMTTSSDNGVNP